MSGSCPAAGQLDVPQKLSSFLNLLARLQCEVFSFHWYVLGTGAQFDEIKSNIAELNLAVGKLRNNAGMEKIYRN